jgi:uncharacterized protein YjbI with pentapeptide repeats
MSSKQTFTSTVVSRIAATAVGSALVATGGAAFTPAAHADIVINGCTINTIGGPEPENHTVCPDADLAGANLSGLQLGYAEFQRANLSNADLSGTDLNFSNVVGANLTNADLTDNTPGFSDFTGANLTGANLTRSFWGESNLTNATLINANLTDARFINVDLTGADLSGTLLIPANRSVTADSTGNAVVSWPTPPSIEGTRFLGCDRESGSSFPQGKTTVTCEVVSEGEPGTGKFIVTVTATPRPGAGSSGFGSSGFGSSGFGTPLR